jgi:hypothetical protein
VDKVQTSWGIAEWYGKDVVTMSSAERAAAAATAIAAEDNGVSSSPQPECPFLSSHKPGSLCNKVGGVCSIRRYMKGSVVLPDSSQPATTCPNRFLEHRADESVFEYISREFFGAESGAKLIAETPFLRKEVASGGERGAKAGRIDWIIVPKPSELNGGASADWIAIETQAVYFSGSRIRPDFEAYLNEPDFLHYPVGRRRPDFRSSGPKRLLPQLEAKAPVMNRWGKKIAVIVDESFFSELGQLDRADDFDNSEVVWLVVHYNAAMELVLSKVIFSELKNAILALQAAKPVNRKVFEEELRSVVSSSRSKRAFTL